MLTEIQADTVCAPHQVRIILVLRVHKANGDRKDFRGRGANADPEEYRGLRAIRESRGLQDPGEWQGRRDMSDRRVYVGMPGQKETPDI